MRRRGGKAGQERSPPDDTGEETDGPVVLPPEDNVRSGSGQITVVTGVSTCCHRPGYPQQAQLSRQQISLMASRSTVHDATCHVPLSSQLTPPVAPGPMQEKKYKSLKTRTVSTIAILAGFFTVLYLGHVPMMLLVLCIQVGGCCLAGQGVHERGRPDLVDETGLAG